MLLVAFLTACPGPSPAPGVDGGEVLQAPEITSVDPTHGPQAGGTVVAVSGANFLEGARVLFGAGEAGQVVVESRRRITARTPAVAAVGPVLVSVINPDGQSALLNGGFTYEADVSRSITDAAVLNPLALENLTGADPVVIPVQATVTVPALTAGAGQAVGIRAQVGWSVALSSPPKSTDFTWLEAVYSGDADGPQPNDKLKDRYEASLSSPGVHGAEVKTVYLVARVSLDEGQSWVIADHDGSGNGFSTTQVSKLRVARPMVGWCRLGGQTAEAPPQVSYKVGQAGVVVYSQVYLAHVTDAAGGGAGIVGQLGYGPIGTLPSSWTWVNGSYNVDTGAGSNDEYQATLPNPGVVGTYAFAYRYSLNGGPFRYCDADGSDGEGYTAAQAGTLLVTPVGIDRCILQGPSGVHSPPGVASSVAVYGRVVSLGLTDAAGAGAGIVGDVGVGPIGTDPSSSGWTWTAATYSSDQESGQADEYAHTLPAKPLGTYDVAYRFKYQSNGYVYCDLDGSANGYQPAQAAKYTVSNATISACKLQYVAKGDGSALGPSVNSGDQLVAYGRVKVPGITDGAGQGAGIRGQVGVGPAGDNASTSALWGWKEAPFFGDVAPDGADEYRAFFNPAYTGTRAVSFRFSLDDGASWTYCDENGTDVGGYEVGQQHALTVDAHADLSFCNLQYPPTLSSGSTAVYGQVPQGAAGAAWVGYGKKSEDPGLAWTWLPAAFNVVVGANDEYVATLGPIHGSYAYAYRFIRTGSTGYCFGDLDASSNGFTAQNGTTENLGAATIP